MNVSVIIVTRNTEALVCAAVRSVFQSRDALAKEIIVVDNGSTDNTQAALAREFPQITFLRSEKNLGFAGANNLGAKRATGEFLLLLNSDAQLGPDTLGQAVDWMRAHPDCGVAGVQLLNPDGSRQNSIANVPSLATELLNKSLLRRLFPRRFPGKEHVLTEPTDVESVIGAFMLIRRTVWDKLGGLDERYFFFLEETDFCLRAQRNGSRVVHLPHITTLHGQGQTARTVSSAARIEYWRSRYIFFARNHSSFSRVLLMAGLLLRLLVDWLAGGLMTVLTLGRSERWRGKWRVCSALWRWHLSGCPREAGLPR